MSNIPKSREHICVSYTYVISIPLLYFHGTSLEENTFATFMKAFKIPDTLVKTEMILIDRNWFLKQVKSIRTIIIYKKNLKMT